MRTLLLRTACLCAVMTWSLAACAQQTVDVDGRVYDQMNGRGLENLEVRMTPPTSASIPVRMANTDQSGGFRFPQVRAGRYLLEVTQGPNLLYRVQIDTATQTHLQVPLQKR